MKIVAIKIGNHWYRAASALPVLAEIFPLFPVSRLTNKNKEYLERKYDFNDLYKYAGYSMKTKEFYNYKKPKQ